MAEFESKKAGDLVSRLVDAFGGTDEYGVVPFVRRWSEVVGTDIAAHSRVVDLRNGALLVGVDHPAWVQRLHMQKTRVLQTIRRRFPQIPVRYIHFVVVDDLTRDIPPGDIPEDERPERPKGSEKQPNRDDRTRAADPESSAADDQDFQQHLEGLRRALEERDSD